MPDDLEQETYNALRKVGAFMGSKGDPSVMNSYKDPPSAFILLLITMGLGIAAWIISELANYYEIKRNWTHYRCMPSIAPFSTFYGHNLAETMNFCVGQSVREHAPDVINPIYKGINVVTGVVDGVYDKVMSIESGVAGLLTGFESFVVNFVNSMRLLGVRVRMAFVRIKDIFARVYGIFIAFSYAAISAITFGENLVCNPLVEFLGIIVGVDICCFAPETQVRLADGSVCRIADLAIGDLLDDAGTVCTTYLFDGSTTKMVRIHGVHVSANHYLTGPAGSMIQAGDHPDAVAAESLSRLWCISTTSNKIPIVTNMGTDTIYADYEESSDPAVIAEAQRVAESQLNGGVTGPPVLDYSLGLDPTLRVFMKRGIWKPLHQIVIGDELMGGACIKGVIREICESQCMSPAGHYVSAAQLILHESRWVRAAHVWPPVDHSGVLYHVMTTQGIPFTVGGDNEMFHVRDYAEVDSMDIQDPYDKSLKG